MTNVVCESKLRSVVMSGTCGRIHAQETVWQSGVRSNILPRLPTHLVQELEVGTLKSVWTKLGRFCSLFLRKKCVLITQTWQTSEDQCVLYLYTYIIT